METNESPRFEFRVFGNRANAELDEIMRTTPVKRTEQQVDQYLLGSANRDYNVKIRDNKLDTKLLMRCQEGLERWHPHLTIEFPLSAVLLREILIPMLHLPTVALDQVRYSKAELQQEFMALFPELRFVTVHKQRRHYQVGDCQLEVAVLYVDHRFYTHTIALEAHAASAVQALRKRLDLDAASNSSYNRGLMQLVDCEWAKAPYTVSLAKQIGFHAVP